MKFLNITLILLLIFTIPILYILFTTDHFKPINSLNIRYNAKNVTVPGQLEKLNPKELSIKEKINAELSGHPLTFKDQIYSMNKYPFVGPKKLCYNKEDCETISTECSKTTNDPFNREIGIGVCTISLPHQTIFDIKH
jgi:hypothetical protein